MESGRIAKVFVNRHFYIIVSATLKIVKNLRGKSKTRWQADLFLRIAAAESIPWHSPLHHSSRSSWKWSFRTSHIRAVECGHQKGCPICVVPVNVNTPPVETAIGIQTKLQLKQQLGHHLQFKKILWLLRIQWNYDSTWNSNILGAPQSLQGGGGSRAGLEVHNNGDPPRSYLNKFYIDPIWTFGPP